MISMMGESVLSTLLYGHAGSFSKLARFGTSVRTVGVRARSSCCCGTPSGGIKYKAVGGNGMRKPEQLLRNLSQGGLITVSQTCGISSSRVVTAAAAVAKAEQGNPATAVASSGTKWDLYAGIVVERKPVITANKDELQEKYAKYLGQLEFELSKKSDHEVRHENDLKMLEKVKTGEIELGNVQTARDDEDKWNAEAQSFQPASRTTEADKKNDIKSLERALDSHLLLVVEQKLGNDFRWICPHSKLEDGETLRQAAERMLRTVFPDMRTKVLGHAPWGFYKYKYPGAAGSTTGAKVFFYKAQIVAGEATKQSSTSGIIRDFAWLKRDELLNKLQPEYHKKLSECLIDE